MANPSLGEEAVQLTRTLLWRDLSGSEMSDRLSGDFRATRGSPCKHSSNNPFKGRARSGRGLLPFRHRHKTFSC